MKDLYKTFKEKRVLITGGLGFIGSNLARALIARGARVTIIDALIPEYGGNLFNVAGIEGKVKVHIADVRDTRSVSPLIKKQDYLFNLAGQTSHLDSMEDPYADLEINCKAQLTILEACRKYNPGITVVFASTRQVYGKPSYLPVDENHLLRPVDVNGINKMAGEWYHIVYNNVYGIKTSVLRLTNTYGPRMRVKDARQTFIGVWIRSLLEGKKFPVWGGRQLRDFNYVEDVVDALLAAAVNKNAYGRIFNLGSPEFISLKDLAKMLVVLNGSGAYQVCAFPARRKKIDIGDYYSDFRYIKRSLGWQPRVALRAGLKATLEFYGEHLSKYI